MGCLGTWLGRASGSPGAGGSKGKKWIPAAEPPTAWGERLKFRKRGPPSPWGGPEPLFP